MADAIPTNSSMSSVIQSLNGSWKIALDPDNRGREDSWFTNQPLAAARDVPVPGIMQAAFPAQHGVAWYWRSFVPTRAVESIERAQLRFNAVDYLAEVWLNGQYLGGHEGGETPFTLDATSALVSGENMVVVRVLNPIKTPIDGVVLGQTPHRNKMMEADFQPGSGKNYGGIIQSVEFLIVPAVRVTDIFPQPDWQSGQIDLAVTLQNDSSPVSLQARIVAGPAHEGIPVVAATFSAEVRGGESHHDITVQIPHHRLWSLDDPSLYTITVSIEATDEQGICYQHERTIRCGFRDFRVVNGYFQLNGKRLWLRSTHTGNHYPIGYYEPVDHDLLRRDLLYAKTCGLNMVRFISGMALPEQLDFCDELGLLVYEENLAAWLLGDSPQLGARFDLSLREMILRDRCHASVVIWGLLNETHDSPTFRHAVDSLALLRDNDPTRLVLLSSGRWDSDLTIGSVSSPHSAQWEPVWGKEGYPTTVESEAAHSHKEPAYYPGVGDVHIYPQVPQSDETNAFLRTIGHDSQPVFVSEYGIGSLLDVVHILGRYQQAAHRTSPAADDVVVFQTMYDSLLRDWERFGMDAVYPFPRDMLRESQRLHSRQRLLGLNLLRSNPHIAGYNLTGMLDHGYTGEGIWTFWREWKPGVIDALEDGFAPLRWCLFTNHTHIYSGRSLTIEAVLANEDVLPPGVYPSRLSIYGPSGRVWDQSATARLPEPAAGEDGPLAVPVIKTDVLIEGPSGAYTLAAHMEQGGSPAGDRLQFYVTDPAELPSVSGTVTSWGIDDHTTAWLERHGVQCRPHGTLAYSEREVILVGDLSALATTEAEWRLLVERIARGSMAVFLSPRAFQRGDNPVGWLPLVNKGRCYEFRNWLYHREDIAKPHPIFAGLPQPGILDWDYYGPVIPRHVFTDQETPDDIAAAFFATGLAPSASKTGYVAGLITASYPCGQGRFLLNSLRILENVDSHPAADRLLLNTITYAIGRTNGPLAPPPADFEAFLSKIGYGEGASS